MAENSMLQMVMLEEYGRLQRMIGGIETELEELPRGYISKKKIRNRDSFYLQWREGDKIKSQYISKNDLEVTQEKVKRRQMLEKSLRGYKKDKRRIEVALGTSFIEQNI